MKASVEMTKPNRLCSRCLPLLFSSFQAREAWCYVGLRNLAPCVHHDRGRVSRLFWRRRRGAFAAGRAVDGSQLFSTRAGNDSGTNPARRRQSGSAAAVTSGLSEMPGFASGDRAVLLPVRDTRPG
jgi:hypothetical protein